ncbi:histidine kinase dimerization/phosphoacceptor domain -containing protein [Oxalobacteraceae bacterium R-40]|uniref:histidine kinase n=1 Tax=Keguizhuia sedimenti TaxID=3064264 RepID=A0ABU1BSL9_9BURK|nr:histidine kinase dimerization/phosphoacceptor domain -containing protein [Oxalobacteraceae bacterium R-40]
MAISSEKMADMGELEFRELADNAPVMIWRSRTDKLCDWFNKPWQDYSGKTQGQLYGYGWAEDVHPEDYDRCVATYVTAFDAREPFTMPYRLRRHDGVYRWFLDNGAPFYREGVFAGYFGSCIDITEQRDLEEHQRVLLAELNHRVKNNLQLILSFLQLSKMGASSDEAKELLQSAMTRVQGVGIMQDELYKSAGGVVELSEYLASLARSTIAIENSGQSTLVAEAQFIEVPHELASNLGLIVNELITNAIKHSGAEAGRIHLRVQRLGVQEMEITVADNGRGFSQESLQAIAKPGNMRGSGLINALARKCNAALSRENDKGAVVKIRLPVA